MSSWSSDSYPLPVHGGGPSSGARVARRARAFILIVLVAIGTWSFITFASSPSQSGQSYLAGYQWCCDASEVSGEWSVPSLSSSPADRGVRNASLWVGVQGPTGQFFLQAGTIDATFGQAHEYLAFWSDPEVGFHPQDMGYVNATDRVLVRLRQSGATWHVTLTDLTLGVTYTRTIRHLPPSDDDFAQWFEEDPIDVLPHGRQQESPFAYTATPTFTHMRVNDRFLDPGSSLTQQKFISSRRTLVYPTAVSNDSFSLLQCPEQAGSCVRQGLDVLPPRRVTSEAVW